MATKDTSGQVRAHAGAAPEPLPPPEAILATPPTGPLPRTVPDTRRCWERMLRPRPGADVCSFVSSQEKRKEKNQHWHFKDPTREADTKRLRSAQASCNLVLASLSVLCNKVPCQSNNHLRLHSGSLGLERQ
ncbi:hypothetical protein Y1Q_0006451 [Alligator mississippiensis]|uniref:Uncharacterized protein n=1 Tax=Alligator mississippiensis TaxID=8496 RepID=A0A151N9A4_ALLMI|nr:hypothetical protein Y1Q_0006451 [Alligator mississippiensis]